MSLATREQALVGRRARDEVHVRQLHPDDLGFVSELHERELSHGLYGELGRPFLRAYQHTFLDSPVGMAMVAEHDGEPAGMLIGTLDNRRHVQWVVRRRGVRLALLGVAGLLTHPRQLLRFLHTRATRYARGLWRRVRPGGDDRAASVRGSDPVAVLTHMAVVEHHRGSGIGAELVTAFVARAAASEARFAQLVTLGDPEGAAGFYRRLGWQLDHQRQDWDGRVLCVFRHDL